MIDLRRISVVIASYNAPLPLRGTLRALRDHAPGAEVIVVDGSPSNTVTEMVRHEFPEVRLVVHRNHGWAHATNRGLELARRDFLLLLNSDLFVTRAALESMWNRLEKDPKLSAVAPVLVNEDGSRQRPFGWLYWPNWLSLHSVTEVPLLHMACVMTRREILHEIGALDETFFLYNEEREWCLRARRAGLRLEMVPERVVHLGGASTQERDPNLTFEMQRGYVYMASRHYPGVVSEVMARLMVLQGWFFSRIDPNQHRRPMWASLEAQMRRRAYGESPFPLSGRGARCATPEWAQQNLTRSECEVRELPREPAATASTGSLRTGAVASR